MEDPGSKVRELLFVGFFDTTGQWTTLQRHPARHSHDAVSGVERYRRHGQYRVQNIFSLPHSRKWELDVDPGGYGGIDIDYDVARGMIGLLAARMGRLPSCTLTENHPRAYMLNEQYLRPPYITRATATTPGGM